MRDILKRIYRHMSRFGVSPSRFGRLSVNDPALVSDLAAGRSLTDRTAKRIDAYLKQVEHESKRDAKPRGRAGKRGS